MPRIRILLDDDRAHEAARTHAYAVAERDEQIERWLTEHDLIARLPPTTKIHRVPLAWQPTGGTPYGRRVLERLVGEVGNAEEGIRNQTLCRCAYTAGGWIAGGELDVDLVLSSLLAAARIAGLPFTEAKLCIQRAVRKGLTKPLYPRR